MSDEPRPVATLHTEFEWIVLYDDGAAIVAGEGDASCTEHGSIAHDDINAAQCDHNLTPVEAECEGDTVPTFDVADFADVILDDGRVQNAAVEDPRIVTEILENYE